MMEARLRECNDQIQKLVKQIEEDQIGNDHVIKGPYGIKRLIYTDHTASGRALSFIEQYITVNVLPVYANTHSGTSHCSRQTTYYREEARDIIRNAVNASSEDCVLFVGSGCTGAVHKLIGAMDLKMSSKQLIVFVGPFEHHSNLLPWRDQSAKVVNILETVKGELDLNDLEQKLKIHSTTDSILIGAFNAASNLTGVLTDTVKVSCLLHRYGALAFWDYASSAPYTEVNMNPVIISGGNAHLAYKDAVYFSMHKFIGGVDSPGILVAKKKLFINSTPNNCGGGTVFFVTPSNEWYLRSIESREEGGTPSIVGSIRAGLVMRLKQTVGVKYIMKRENEICSYVYSQWKDVPGLVITGPAPSSVDRLPIFSLVFNHPETDLFGIQARGGCSCAGPYAQSLLGINEELANRYEAIIMQDGRLFQDHFQTHDFSEREILRPGVTRLSFPYFFSQEVINFIIKAVVMVAKDGWKLLPLYQLNPETGLFRHPHYHPDEERVWLSSLSFTDGLFFINPPSVPKAPPTLEECLKIAQKTLEKCSVATSEVLSYNEHSFLINEAEELRWFLLPREANECLHNKENIITKKIPFQPRVYNIQNKTEQKEEMSLSEEREVRTSKEGKKQEEGTSHDVRQHVWFHHPPKAIMKNVIESISDYNMIHNGDRVLVCLSGGKDSLSLLHTLKQHQFISEANGIHFKLGAVTIDPGSSGYNPRPLIPYLASLGIPYFFEEQAIMQQALDLPEIASICSFCSRMKRGRLYACARREGYNVLAMGQHLDDLAESFLMSAFHNGLLRTMKANYTVQDGDLRVIRPLVYVRERDLNSFAKQVKLPVISENCPACFAAPKERERIKQLLAAQEIMFPRLYHSILTAMKPIMEKELRQESQHNNDDV